jgi:hypothetical protein
MLVQERPLMCYNAQAGAVKTLSEILKVIQDWIRLLAIASREYEDLELLS